MPYTPKSTESLNTTASSAKHSSGGGIFYRSTILQVPRYGERIRHQNGISSSSEVQKRVLSAKRLQLKSYQNEIMDAHQIISKLSYENRILRTQIKRQDAELAKYISTNAELPRLLHSHEEEIRIMNEKFRNLFKAKQDIENKLKQKETMILALSDKNKFYSRLNKDKQLDERARLTEKLNVAKNQLQAKEDEIKLIYRKQQLEEKKWRQLLQTEQKKVKDLTQLLEKARLEQSMTHKYEEANMMLKHNSSPFSNMKNYEKIGLVDCIDKITMKTSASTHNEEKENSNAAMLTKSEDETCHATANDNLRMPSSPRAALEEVHEEHVKMRNDAMLNDETHDHAKDHHALSNNFNRKKSTSTMSLNKTSTENLNKSAISLPTNKTDEEVVEGISKIRQQITKDSKERESFLDAFCRQASRITLEESSTNSMQSNTSSSCNTTLCISSTHNSKKQSLLAALKAIDDNKSLD